MKIRIVLSALFLLVLTSCHSSLRFAAERSDHSSAHLQGKNRLQQAAERWLGVPYRYGGNDRTGIDCSGLAVQLYREVFHLKLPRNAAAQRTLGYAVHAPYLKPGDLLFFRFKGEEGIEHVAVYLGNDRFVHASRSRGVVINKLNDPYYRRHLIVIRRVLH